MSVFIIAEVGVNHNGNLETALKLVDKAKESGADCVKFQTFKAENLVSKKAVKADYQIRNTESDSSQYSMLKKLELTADHFAQIKRRCDDVGIEFLSSPFDSDGIKLLQKLQCRRWKVPSGEVTNYPYLVECAKTRLPIIVSTGMCDFNDIDACLRVLKENGAGEISLLHCTTEYPAPLESVNLRAMLSLKERYGCKVGYSDHTQGIDVSLYAAAMGAEIIEKHFTLDKNLCGPDHKASLEPKELKALVDGVRRVEKILGDGNKMPQAAELCNIAVARKSIVAKCSIKKGVMLTQDNITTKRPGNGLSPMLWNSVIGTKAVKDYEADDLIIIEDF